LKQIFITLIVLLSTTCGWASEQVNLVYVAKPSDIASTNVVKVLLEKMGYEVAIKATSVEMMWNLVAKGGADAMVSAWLPITHFQYLEDIQGEVMNLGPNFEGSKMGLVVPNYVTIDSIEELNEQAERLQGKIIGVDSQAKIMQLTAAAMARYELGKFQLVAGDETAMIKALEEAINRSEWIVVTGWTPHWKFARWPLKYLKDPQGAYGEEESINTIVHKTLIKEKKDVFYLLDNFFWTASDLEKVMLWNQEAGADPYQNAQRWVKENYTRKVLPWLATREETVNLVYGGGASEMASSQVVEVMLENLGYHVNIFPTDVRNMWQMVADGSADGMVSAWLPSAHRKYLENFQDQVENLGPNLEGTKMGLVVPDYVTLSSINELNAQADQFAGKLIGVEPGAGVMRLTKEAMSAYGLDKFKLVPGDEATMIRSLEEAINKQVWIVVTGWRPHWKFARWPLKYLADPKKIYGEEESINTIVRRGLKEDSPEVYQILDNFHWAPVEMEELMTWNQEPESTPLQNAEQWVKVHHDIMRETTVTTYDINTGQLHLPTVEVYQEGVKIGIFKAALKLVPNSSFFELLPPSVEKLEKTSVRVPVTYDLNTGKLLLPEVEIYQDQVNLGTFKAALELFPGSSFFKLDQNSLQKLAGQQ